MKYYDPATSLEELYAELGATDYNLEVLQSSMSVLQEARNELLVLIQQKLAGTDKDLPTDNVLSMASRKKETTN